MTDQTYHLTLTKPQAETIMLACEIMARLSIGQFRFALESLPLEEPYPAGWHESMDTLGGILSRYMLNNVDGYRRSLGIRSEHVKENGKTAWDIYQVIRRRLSWERAVETGLVESLDSPRNWHGMMGVHYDEPLRTSKEPLAVILSQRSSHARVSSGN